MRNRTSLVIAIAAFTFMTWGAVALQTQRVDDRALRNAGRNGEWTMVGLNYSEQRYSPLKQIDTTNVGRLELAWSYEVGTGGGQQEATPLVINGVIYAITNWSVAFALDARTGKELWRYDPEIDRKIDEPGSDQLCCGVLNRGVAAYEGKIFVPTNDGRLIALDAKNGRVLWSVQATPKGDFAYSLTMAPRVIKGKVIIGNAGAEFPPYRGYFSAFDANTGKELWRFYTIPAIHRSLSRILLWRRRPRRGRANGGSLAAAAPYGTGWRTIRRQIFCMSGRATERPGRTRYGKEKDRTISITSTYVPSLH
jgi:quinohemoprotein ethanol dehydrogenase